MVPVGELQHPGGVGGFEGLLERGLAQLLKVVEEEAIGGEQELHHGVRVDVRKRRVIGGRLLDASAGAGAVAADGLLGRQSARVDVLEHRHKHARLRALDGHRLALGCVMCVWCVLW